MTSAPFLLEVGCEEIPAGVVGPAAEALRLAVVATLDAAGIGHGEAIWLGTPRRLAVHVSAVGLQQPDREETLLGPPIRAAKDPDGDWTQAALGFANGQGVDATALFEHATAKGVYVAARKQLPGQATARLLAEKLPEILRNLPFPKRMRWGARPETFCRPLQWLVALLGDQTLSVAYAGVEADALSRGHRFYHPGPVRVAADRAEYEQALWDAKVMVDPAVREQVILRGIHALAAEANGTWHEDRQTLATVVQLVEWPAPLLGTFAAEYLDIPAPVIRTTLRENQKLFTLTGPDGALLPHFIAVANTLAETSRATIAAGNTRVVAARLADARFFVAEDTRTALAEKVPQLQHRVYMQGLAEPTLLHKVVRLQAVAQAAARRVCPGALSDVERSAYLCKADLSSKVVFEFPELQGFVGADYARRDGEAPGVVAAIADHYLPRFAGDALPGSPAAAVVALADKLDAIACCFTLNLVPTGTQDPYALRRAALGVLRILADAALDLDLPWLVATAVRAVQAEGEFSARGDATVADILGFFRGRLLAMHTQEFPTDLVEAVLDADFAHVATVRPRLAALDGLRQGDGFAPLAAAFKRIGNIVRKQGGEVPAGTEVDVTRFAEPAEGRLHGALQTAHAHVKIATDRADFAAACAALVALKPAVDGFFDDVMVMAEDVALRHNRLALLGECRALFSQIADFSRIAA